ncbi:MAG: hypothetical protein CMN75_17185 [Spirochaeta sp.]|nr:hypothetical protein [Spirochaeta sp.]
MLARMMPRVKMRGRIVLIALIWFAAIGLGESQAEEEAARDDKSRWVPAFGLSSGAYVQRFQGSLSASPLNCGTAADPTCAPNPFSPRASPDLFDLQPGAPSTDRERVFTPFIAAGLELTTPSLIDGFGAPSLFAHVDFAYTFGFTKNIAVLGAPGPLAPPPPLETDPRLWKGQGDSMTFKASDFQFSGGVGITFHLDVLDRRVRVKPSLEYMRQSMTLTGFLQRVIATEQGGEDLRFIEFGDSEKVVFHSIGPGLELEVDAARKGPLVLALYGGAQAYAILGSNRVNLSDSNDLGESAEWKYIANRWFFRGSVGLRFRWAPE